MLSQHDCCYVLCNSCGATCTKLSQQSATTNTSPLTTDLGLALAKCQTGKSSSVASSPRRAFVFTFTPSSEQAPLKTGLNTASSNSKNSKVVDLLIQRALGASASRLELLLGDSMA